MNTPSQQNNEDQGKRLPIERQASPFQVFLSGLEARDVFESLDSVWQTLRHLVPQGA